MDSSEVETNGHKKKGWKQADPEMSQSIDLFRKYLQTKSENHKVGKTNKEESDVINKSTPTPLIPLIPYRPSNFLRPLSLLERNLLPGIKSRSDEPKTMSSSGTGRDKYSSKTQQLTIFYAGVINVYDDVPANKAEAIMLLAGERRLSRPIANEKPKTTVPPLLHIPNVQSSCKLQADIPAMARKISLQHFIEKRRQRIVNNCPYPPAAAAAKTTIHNKDEEKDELINTSKSNHNINHTNSQLSPFPSRLGYFSPLPTDRGCQG